MHQISGKIKLIDIECRVEVMTEKAYALDNGTTEKVEGVKIPVLYWVPRSQVEVNLDGTVTMPEWLAYEKGLI